VRNFEGADISQAAGWDKELAKFQYYTLILMEMIMENQKNLMS
jgi:hypothetical protein